MNKKQKLTALALSVSIMTGSTALANSSAPASQFGFSGWPYRQNNSCYTQPSVPQPTEAPTNTPAPKPTATKKPDATIPPSNGDDYTTPSISVQEENALFLLNQDRIANGLPALKADPVLCSIARAKSKDMSDRKYFSHTSPTYGTASQMLKHFGYSFTSVGENIAHHANVDKAQAAFMSSAGHRANILSKTWTKFGIGICYDANGSIYATQIFAR